MNAFDGLREGLGYVRIVHHLRGRVRLRLDPGAEKLRPQPGAAAVPQLQDIRGIHSVRVNVLARSCTIEYDPTVIPAEAWSDFLGGTRSAAAGILEDILREKYEELTIGILLRALAGAGLPRNERVPQTMARTRRRVPPSTTAAVARPRESSRALRAA